MILQPDAKVLVCHRRLFDHDQPRFFVGKVLEYEDGIVKISGYPWIREQVRGDLLKKNDIRTKIVSITSGMIILYELPTHLDIDSVRLEARGNTEVVLTDGAGFEMDLTDRRHTSRS